MSYTIEDDIKRKIRSKLKELTRKQIKQQLKKNGYGRHTYFETDLAVSKAWLSLNGTCKSILVLCLLKRQMRFLKKGDKIPTLLKEDFTMTYKELEAPPLGFHPEQIRRCLKTLLVRGFIKIMYQGGAFKKDKTIYGISDNWQMWETGKDFSPKKKDVNRGYQAKGLGAVKTISTHKKVSHTRTQKCEPKMEI